MKKIYVFLLLLSCLNPLGIQAQQTEKELLDLKTEANKQAFDIAKSYNIRLDYSDNSIKDVEFMLGDFHKDYAKTKDTKGLVGIAMIFGFYIIEVIEKNHGVGRIERNHESIGEDSFPFYWNGTTLFPYGWCLKRIFDGDGDNVELKYKMFVLNEQK